MKRITQWHALALCLIFIVLSWWVQDGGLLLYGEADWFLIDHNDPGRPLLEKIFCPHKHDADQYLAREISHVVEHLDARFIHFCTRLGFPHFQSVCTYAFLLFISLLVFRFLKSFRGLLLLCLFWTSPPIFYAGSYARPGHVHAAFWAAVLVVFLYHNPDWPMKRLVIFILALLSSWADRQGMLFCGVAAITLLMIKPKDFRIHSMLISAAIVCHWVWYLWIGPVLVESISGFKVGKEYQMGAIANSPTLILRNLPESIRIAGLRIGNFLGGISPGLSISGVVVAACYFKRQWFLFWFLSMAVMYALILHHQNAIRTPDTRSVIYYAVFSTVMIFLVCAWLLPGLPCKLSVCFMAAMLAGNISMLPEHLRAFKSGHLSGFIAGAPHLRKALRETARMPDGSGTNQFDTISLRQCTGFEMIMKNPLEYGGGLTAEEFVESSNYLQWFRSRKGLPFGKAGR